MTAVKTGHAEPKHVTTVEGISEYRLENGTRVLLFPDPSKPQITVNMTVFVGSRHEGYGEAGMAHLLEHMLFKGTPDHPNIPKVLKEHGADFNGTTWLDRTNYYETLPASDPNLEFAIRLEADRLVNSYVKAEDLASEMTVVRNEFERGENSPSRILDQRMMSAAYEWHNYGKSTIGNRADIERVPVESLRRFYKKYYQPDNVMVIVAGAFEPERALELIQKYFGSIPRPERVLEETYTEEPPQDGERLVTLNRVGDVAMAGAIYHIPAGGHEDFVSIEVLEQVLTAAPSGRLYKALVETRKAAIVGGGAYALHDPGILKLLAEVIPGVDPRDVLSTMLEVTESVGDQEISEEEVERAKTYWLKIWDQYFQDSSSLAKILSEWASQGDWRLMFLYRDRIEKVTPEDVTRVAKKYLRQNNRTAGLFIPTKEPQRVSVPPTPELAEVIGDYKGRETIAMGEAFDVSPANIEKRSIRETLPGGFKAVYLPKKTRGESVTVQINLRYGTVETLTGKTTSSEVLPSLMLKGTKHLTRQQIRDALDRNKASVQFEGSSGEASFAIQTRKEYLPEVLDIIRQVLREPTFPAEELEIIRNEKIAELEQQLNDPMGLARIAVSQAITAPYPPDDVRYVASLPERIERWKSLKQEDVAQLYERFVSGQHGEIAIVGDFEKEKITPILGQIFNEWATSEPYAHIPRKGDVKIEGKVQQILTPDKENAVYLAGSAFPISDSSEDYPSLVIGNFILGSSGLSSRLGDRVRQKEGLSYGIASYVNASAKDDRTTFLVFAITNPLNMSKVQTAIREEIERLRAEGITEEELAAAKTGYLENQIVERSDDKHLAGLLALTAHLNRDMSFYEKREKTIEGLTAEQVDEAVRKWLNLDRLAIIEAGDFEKVQRPDAP